MGRFGEEWDLMCTGQDSGGDVGSGWQGPGPSRTLDRQEPGFSVWGMGTLFGDFYFRILIII
jgi:hypothetical protein